MTENKITRGRPFKMTAWVEQLKVILETEDILFLSDKDLQFLVNRTLPKEDQITDRTFENWKAGKFHENEEVGREFLECIQYALIRQKQELSKKMFASDTKEWYKVAWVMERKFHEWNLKHISENINRNEQAMTINITAGNEEQKALMERLLYAPYTNVEPMKIEEKSHNESDENVPF